MRTSRVSQDTAKMVKTAAEVASLPRRQTRSFAASIRSFSANGLPVEDFIKQEDSSESTRSGNSTQSQDIEDSPLRTPEPKKRKRDFDTPSTAITSISTSASTRTSPRKAGSQDATPGRIKKARRQPAKRITKDDGSVEVQPPPNWEEIYSTVQDMRRIHLAPVDTMGCERIADRKVSPKDQRFQTLISLMLSSQTKDTTNALTMRRLQTELPAPGLTLQNILEIEPDKLNELIWAVGFHNNKTRYIKAAAPILRDEYNGDIPDTVEGLMSLPGVGPKMAYLCLSAAWDKHEGIGVDVHVHRITNLWGWHKTRTRDPEETRASLESWLPRSKWHEINHMLVGFGQTICKPVGRDCSRCTLAEKGLCPSAEVSKKTVFKTTVVEKEGQSIVKVEKEDVDEDLEVKQVVERRVALEEGEGE